MAAKLKVNKNGSKYYHDHQFIISKDEDGRAKRKSVRFVSEASGLREARADIEEQVRKYKIQLEKGTDPKQTFKEYVINVWKPEAIATLSDRAFDDYTKNLENHILPSIGSIKIAELRVHHLRDLFQKLRSQGKSQGTIKKVRTALKSVLDLAYTDYVIIDNPLNRIKMPRETEGKAKKPLCFNEREARFFLAALSRKYNINESRPDMTWTNHFGELVTVKGYNRMTETEIPYQWQVYFTLAIISGLRRGEMIGLTWNDIDFKNGSISVSKSVERIRNRNSKGSKTVQQTKAPKTSAGERIVSGLPFQLFNMLRSWQEQQKEICRELSNKWKGQPIYSFGNQSVFISEDGSQMKLDLPSIKFRKILQMINKSVEEEASRETDPIHKEVILQNKLPEITLHGLRHSFVSLLIANDVDIKTTSGLAGHARSDVTLNVYAHYQNRDDAVRSALTRVFFEDEDQPAAKA